PISEDVIPLVLKSDLTPVFPDEVGRLYMGGASLFSGYLRSPELTESVFVRTPEVGGRLYDTSDDVRLLSDGTIEYVGRVDHTVKVRGFRVNTQEVEGAILVHPDVATAAVVVRNRGSAHEMLVAFVTPADIDRDDVVRTLRDRLPSYMLPSLIIPLETLPLTVSGKVDRGRLLDMGAAPEDPAGAASRRSTTESRVRAVWKRALGHEQFDDESSYFEVGGTSLRIFDLVARLREEFGLAPAELTVQDVYRFPTVASLAACVDSAEYAEASVEPAPLLVPLKQGADPKAPPFFLIATAGGTLGAYERLAQRLDLPRDVIGVRDPFIWGERDPTKGFRDWIELYLRAIRGRQGAGPYYLGAYSSAGAFGYELARRLREEGEEVALLALIDPLVMDRGSRWRYGYWVLRATYMRSSLREIVRFVGRVRALVHGLTTTLRGATPESDYTPSIELMNHITTSVTRDRGAVMRLAGLMELNTGLPVSLDENDFAGKAPDEYFGVFLSRLAAHLPDVEPESVERIAVQYQLQVNSQHAYQLTPYDGAVLLIEPATGYAGLVATQLRPYLRDLKARILPVGDPSPRVAALARRFGVLDKHYRSMRDDRFVAGVVAELDPLLR
ncbi:MAG: phosphopantetheine-binding protein, partial [Dehalococcoidia bacterium]